MWKRCGKEFPNKNKFIVRINLYILTYSKCESFKNVYITLFDKFPKYQCIYDRELADFLSK